MVGALSQLWGLINGLSLFVHLPLLGSTKLAPPDIDLDVEGDGPLTEGDGPLTEVDDNRSS